MAKQLNLSIGVRADTSQARAQFQALQADLVKLGSMSTIGTFNNADMQKAIQAAKDLQLHLNNAVNVDTGKLDLSRFSKSLKSAGQSLESIRNDLSLAGAQGDQAFLQLARSISQAEAPAIRVNNTLREMGNTLKNTIRWQLSSSLLHGFMGAVQEAYGYAQDLNKSLNDIRIVSSQSADQMDKFAVKANNAAKALGASTLAYTEASLIFYQQGLSGDEVEERTNVVLKMANVTGESAEDVSSYMTAIWNNFADGSKSLEYYGDVMAELGAKTAASSEEIAAGLEKFASIGDTVGLSFEYATAAMATIVDKTRASADTVGTALKTIFARLQGLQLGETLEDGVDLNKYSTALEAVGVEVLDLNGNLREADDIIYDLGMTWETLTSAQQTALAQTVAGTRQYTQLMSLMNNFDDFQANVESAHGSEGTLSVQADIYAQSWEAAQKRVQAAAEDVYDSLIDDDFFIGLTNGMANFIDGIGTVVDGLGGMKGILTLVGSLFLTHFSKEIPGALQKLGENFSVFTGKAQKDAISMMEQNQSALEHFTSDNMTNSLDAELAGLTKVNEMKTVLARTSHTLTEAERQQFEQEIQMVEAAGQMVQQEAEKVDAIERVIAANERKLAQDTARAQTQAEGAPAPTGSNFNAGKEQAQNIQKELGNLKQLTNQYVACEQVMKRLNTANNTWLKSGKVSSKSMIKDMKVFKQSFIDAKGGVDKLTKAEKDMCDALDREIKDAKGDVDALKKAFETFGKGVASSLDGKAFDNMDKEIAEIEARLRGLGVNNEALNELEQQFREGALSADEYRQKLLALQNTESQSVTHAVKMSETIGFVGAKMMQVSMAANTLKQAWNIWSDEDATLGEKILTTMTALGTVIPIVTAVTNADNAAQTASHALNLLKLVGLGNTVIAKKLSAAASVGLAAAEGVETGAVVANTTAWYANPIMWIALIIMAVIAAIALLITGIMKLTEWLIKGDKIETENCDTLIENAEKTKELAEANQELSSSMEDLIEEYKEMNAEGENTAGILQEITDAMPALIQSYRDFADVINDPAFSAKIDQLERLANVGALTGDYSAFEAKKEEVDDDVAIATAQSAKSGATGANTLLAAKMQEEQGKVKGKSYTLHVGGAEGGGAARDEKDAIDILEREMGDYAQNKEKSGRGIDLKLDDYSDPLELVDYYEKMVKARDAMLDEMTDEQIKESDTFREINEMIKATASEYEAAKEQADEYLGVAGRAAEAEVDKKLGMDMADADTMEEYLAYRKEFLKVAQDEYSMTEEQALAYLKQSDALSEMNNKYELAAMMAEKFGEGIEDFETDLSDSAKKSYMTAFEELTKDLEGEDFALAIQVMADTDSIEEFENEILRLGAKRETARYEQMGGQLSTMMSESQENGGLTTEHMSSLGANEDFQDFLGENGVESMGEFGAMNYDEQYAMLAEFHAKVQALRFDSAQYQKDLYYDDLAANQEILDKMYAMTEEEEKKSLEMKQAYADKQAELNKEGLSDDEREKIEEELEDMEDEYEDEFGFAIDLDTTDVKNKMQEIEDQIKALDEQQIKIAIEWDGIEEIEGAFENVGDFAATMQKDAKKVGNSYQLTAAQAREWMEVYPDLFKQAEVTSDGLISLDQNVVDEYINGQNAEVDATVDAKIAELEAERTAMEAKLQMAEADLEAAAANAQGKAALEGTSAEYLANLRKGLVQYYMDLGLDEAEANAAALETMGLNEQEYTDLVAAASEKNAQNQINASKDGGNAQASALSQLAQKWSKFTTLLKKVAAAVKAALTGGDVSEAWDSIGSTVSVDSSSYEGADLSGYEFDASNQEQIDAAREAVNLDLTAELEANKANIQKALDSIDSQITYLNALKNQDIADYGSTDPDDVDGSNDKSGGGGSKSTEDLIEVAERYHEITREIEYYNHLLDENSKKKDRAFGKDKLKYMKEEQRLLEEKYKREKDLFELQSAFLISDQAAIQDAFSGATFDPESFELTNYTDMLQQAANRLNDAKEKFNNSDQDDADKEALEKAEEEYDKQIELLEQYEETIDEWREQKANLQDLANEIYDAKLEEVNYKVELQVEIEDDKLAYLEYLLEKIENRAFSAADAIANLGKQTQSVMNQNASYKSGIMEIFGNHGLSEADMEAWLAGDPAMQDKISNMSFTEDEVSSLREYTQGLMDTNEAAMELRQSVHDKMLSTFEEWNEKIDGNLAKLEHLQAMTESYRNIVDLVGKNNFAGGAETITRLNESAVLQAGNTATANIANRDRMAAQLQATRDAYAQQKDIISEEERKMWEDTIAEMETQLNEAEETAMDSIASWMEAINQQFIDSVEATMDEFSDMVAGKFASLNELQEAFERKQSEKDRYLEDYEKIYEFSKLNRDIEKSIDNSSNVKAKKELAQLQAEINELEESGAEISEYQMENLRKRYELKLAELALEEAQNAKSEVRMTRDSEGNWGYVYTADETQVAAAEQSYEDKLFELQQQNADYINTLQENIIQMQIEMKEKMAEIANDESLSIEERQAKMAEVQQYYQEQMGYYCSELELALGNNKQLYEDDWTKYSEATDYKIAKDSEYVDDFAETDLAILTGFTNMEGYQATFNEASANMLADNNQAFEDWQTAMEEGPLAAMNSSFETLASDIDGHLGTIEEESGNTTEAIQEDCETSVGNYQTVIDKVIEWENQYSTSVSNMMTESDNLIAKFQSVLDLWAQVQEAASQPTPEPPSAGDGGDGGDGGSGGGDGGSGGKPSWDRIVAAYNKINQGKWGNGISNRIKKGAADGFTEAEVRGGQQLINYTYPPNLNGYGYSRDKAKQLMGYDTGGYTGAWGESGKLALLHEKELVLNKEDTANMLTAIDMIRQISSMIDLNAMSSMKGFGGILAAGGVGQTMGGIEQHIEIHASFPDATDHSEIEEAFHNLLNSASQYANRKL